MKTWRSIRDSRYLSRLYACLIVLLIVCRLFFFAEGFFTASNRAAVIAAIPAAVDRLYMLSAVLILSLFVLKLRRGFSAELGLLTAFFVWVLVTRAFYGEFEFRNVINWYAVCAAVFAAGFCLNAAQKRFALGGASLSLIAALTLCAVLALAVIFAGPASIGRGGYYIRPLSEDIVGYIGFFDVHRNIAAAWFLCALFLSVCYFVSCKKRLVRAALIALMALFFVMLAVERCRSVYVASSVGAGMLAALGVLHKSRRHPFVKRLTAALLALVCAAACYESLVFCGDTAGIRSAAVEHIPAHTQAVSPVSEGRPFAAAPLAASQNDAEEDASPNSFRDTRSFRQDLLTLNGRTAIWEAGFRAIREKPLTALIGRSQYTLMNDVNRLGNFISPVQHMHSMLMQVLLLTGVPGFLLILAFVARFLLRVIRHCFSRRSRLTFAQKVSAVLPVTLLVYSIAEPLLTMNIAVPSLFFLLTAGLFTETCRQSEQGAHPASDVRGSKRRKDRHCI